jgi:hypothetical protein
MKTSKILFVLLLTAATAHAQSNSYNILKHTFSDQPDVHSFSFSGWVGRLILRVADEHEFRNAIKDLQHVRFIEIPKAEFAAQNLSVKGFKNVLIKDSFQELAFIRDKGEEITIYLREGNNHKNQYFVLVEEEHQVVAIELKGYLDPQLLNPKNTTLATLK